MSESESEFDSRVVLPDDPNKWWERLPGEPNLWWTRFEEYRLAGPTRNLMAQYNKRAYPLANFKMSEKKKENPQRPSAPWKTQARIWRWKERAEAWDEFELKRLREEWAKRREQWREEEWQLADSLRRKAIDMLVFPVAKITRSEDGKTTIIEPADWKFGDIPKIVDIASKLARLSSGLATEHTETIEWNPNDFSDEELELIASTGDVRAIIARRKQNARAIGDSIKEEDTPALLAP